MRACVLATSAAIFAAPGCASDPTSPPAELHTVRIELANVSSAGALVASDGSMIDIVLSSGVAAAHDPEDPLLVPGTDLAGTPFEALAEDGDSAPLYDALRAAADDPEFVVTFSDPYGTDERGLLGPQRALAFELQATADARVSFVMMFVQSNDVLLGTVPEGIVLAPGEGPHDATASLALYDAGTEADEEPGIGPNQAPRQSGPDSGPDQSSTLRRMSDPTTEPFPYPAVADFLIMRIETD